MKKIIYSFLAVALIFASCDTKKENKKKIENNTEKNKQKTFKPTKTYAVVWKWKTNDVDLVDSNMVAISNELQKLYKNNIVENAYYNANSKVEKFEYFPNVMFFIKAKGKEIAEKTLNNLTIVKKQIATYTLYEVGVKMFGRNKAKSNEHSTKSTFVSVWSIINKPTEKQKQVQFDLLKYLYEKGLVENIYLDLEDAKSPKSDFVLFVNANDEKQAKKILNDFPFSKENIYNYKLYPVGAFWLGEHKK